jgi:hypothetical protein
MKTVEDDRYGAKTRGFGGFALRGLSWRMRMDMLSSRLKLRNEYTEERFYG